MAKRPAEKPKGKEGLVRPPEQPRGWPGDKDQIVDRGQSRGIHRYDERATITGAVEKK